MRQIIDGMRYDTDTATLVASFGKGNGRSDFHVIREELYVTDAGRWFVAGEGGARSSYRIRHGDMWGPGSEIRPLSDDEARRWLEEHNRVAAIEEYFSDSIVDA